MTPAFPGLQASIAFYIVPSDTVDVKDDANNPAEYPFVFLHNPGSSAEVRVLPAGMGAGESDANAVTIYIPQGTTCPLAVRRVYATDPVTAEDALIGFVSKQR